MFSSHGPWKLSPPSSKFYRKIYKCDIIVEYKKSLHLNISIELNYEPFTTKVFTPSIIILNDENNHSKEIMLSFKNETDLSNQIITLFKGKLNKLEIEEILSLYSKLLIDGI